MTRYTITTKASFTEGGQLGVLLFLAAPIGAAVGYVWLLAEFASYGRPNPLGPALLMSASGFVFLIGCVLMLVGRSHVHEVRPVDTPAANQGEGSLPFGGTEAERAAAGLAR